MIKKTKLTLIFLILLNLNNFASAENIFLKTEKKNMMKKSLKSQNFYFKKV